MAILILRVHYELLNSNQPLKCDHVVDFLLLSHKRLCTVALGIRLEDISVSTFQILKRRMLFLTLIPVTLDAFKGK